MESSKIFGLSGMVAIAALLSVAGAYADAPPDEQYRERIPVQEQAVAPTQASANDCGWGARLSAGVPVWFFDDESTSAGAGAYLDVFPCETPINLRIGIEGRHIDIDQPGAEQYAEWPGKTTELTYIRIPMAVEYVMPLAENANWYIGGGPDLIRTANDLSDFAVGAHVATRLGYDFENNISVAIEGGYMWAEVDDGGPDINLDGAYVLPTVGYRF